MNISRPEQRVLHVLAQGGWIRHDRGPGGKLRAVTCFTHDGMVLSACSVELVQRLRRKKLIRSEGGKPYRISRLGRAHVRAQLNNRTGKVLI